MSRREDIIYRGVTYYRYPDSQYPSQATYFKNNCTFLHRKVWEDHHGKIRKGYQIHHKDHNPANNAIENLERVTPKQHMEKHPWTEDQIRRTKIHLDKVRYLANAWHRSPEAFELHSRNGKKTAHNRKPTKCICQQYRCGREFITRAMRMPKFCSNNCKQQSRRDSKVDFIENTCIVCGKTYRHDRVHISNTCSRHCRSVLIYRNRTKSP